MSVTLPKPKDVAEVTSDASGSAILFCLENDIGEIQQLKSDGKSTQLPFAQYFSVIEVAGPVRDVLFDNSASTLRYALSSASRAEHFIDLSCTDLDTLTPLELQLETADNRTERGLKISLPVSRDTVFRRPISHASLLAVCVAPNELLIWTAKRLTNSIFLKLRFHLSFAAPVHLAALSSSGLFVLMEKRLVVVPFSAISESKERITIDTTSPQNFSHNLPANVKQIQLALPNVILLLFTNGTIALYGYHGKSKRDVLLPLKLSFSVDHLAVLPQVLHEGIDGLLALASGGHSIFYSALTKVLDRYYEWEDSLTSASSSHPFSLTIPTVLFTTQPVKQLVAIRMDCIASVSDSCEVTVHIVNSL